MGRFEGFLEALNQMCEEYNKEQERKEEEKAEMRKEFESEHKVYNRGTVITAMAEEGWDSFDMKRVLEKVDNPEKAEAAVGLIKAGRYDSFDIRRMLEAL